MFSQTAAVNIKSWLLSLSMRGPTSNCVRDNNWFIIEVQFNEINIYLKLSVPPNVLEKLQKFKHTWSTTIK